MVTPARETDTRPAPQPAAPSEACPTHAIQHAEPVNPRRAMLAGLGGLAAGAFLASTANAGPLTPPPGPIAPTPGPEPRIAINATNTPGNATALFRITQPGSYYLTGNITGVVGRHGIEIAASGVTLDLNGFDLVGVPGMGAFDGVRVTVNGLTNIAILNGSVRNWGGAGVFLGTAINCRVEGVRASGNTGSGIRIGTGCTVANCAATSNTDTGIFVGTGCTVSNCSAFQNTGTGIFVGTGSTVSNCLAFDNTSTGIFVGSGCTVSNCSAYDNTNQGITTGNGCTVSNCSAFQNTTRGISVSEGCTVEGCTVRQNTFNGIVCSRSCVIRGNTCSSNGNGGDGAGILATSNDNRIEGNNSTDADRGIDVKVNGNIIIRNTCSGNTTNWSIVANNVVGPILDRRAPASAAISGNTAPSSLGTTDPNANFTY